MRDTKSNNKEDIQEEIEKDRKSCGLDGSLAGMRLTEEQLKAILSVQRSEITEYYIYRMLARVIKDKDNLRVIEELNREEIEHYEFFKRFTGQDVRPNMLKIWLYYIVVRVFGLTFGLKLMERAEAQAERLYNELVETIPDLRTVIDGGDRHHELFVLSRLYEERLEYAGSIILGLNDALVELTGMLAGLTFAISNTRLVAIAGLITGIAAAFSMAASEYLSTKTDALNGCKDRNAVDGKDSVDKASDRKDNEEGFRNKDRWVKSAGKAAVYTGITYIITVLLLVFPYFLVDSAYAALFLTLFVSVIIIGVFSFYLSVARGISFRKRFAEMVGLCFSVSGMTFLLGIIIRKLIGTDI